MNNYHYPPIVPGPYGPVDYEISEQDFKALCDELKSMEQPKPKDYIDNDNFDQDPR